MKAFFDKPELKAELLAKLKHHQELDTFVQGAWLTNEKVDGNGFKGCFYGCTMQTCENAIEKFSEKYNIDLWYCFLTEKVFEGLPKGEFERFPIESIEIVLEGFDFNKAKSLFHYRLLDDQLRFAGNNDDLISAIKKCRNLFTVPFNEIDRSAARSACSAARSEADSADSAYSVARSAADSAHSAYSVARSAADSAARSEADSAGSAARSAWLAARSARSEADSDYYVFMRDLLFQSIKETI